jgi:hypothetical protein
MRDPSLAIDVQGRRTAASAPLADAPARLAQLEAARRRELLVPAAATTLVLLLSGYLPALVPAPLPPMLIWLSVAVALCGSAIWSNRSGYGQTAIVLYMLGVMLFYFGAIYAVPSGAQRMLSYAHFTAGNAYYFVLGALPVFASTLLLDAPWPAVLNVVLLLVTQSCVWLLPHDASFYDFSAGVGGPAFLAASVALGQVMLFAFALATARTARNALVAAGRAADLEAINAQISAQQVRLEEDIHALQLAHARIAAGEWTHVQLTPGSELFPVGASLNIMIDRLAKLSRTGYDLAQIERGLHVVAQTIAQISQGDLRARPAPTGTAADGVLAVLVQMQGQIANWVQEIGATQRESAMLMQQMVPLGADLVMGLRQVEEMHDPTSPQSDDTEMVVLARQSAESLYALLQAAAEREHLLGTAIRRIRMA